jgi:hypothetical protein
MVLTNPVSNWVTKARQAFTPRSEGRQIRRERCSVAESEVLQNSEKEEVTIDWRCPEQEWTAVDQGLLKGTKQACGLGDEVPPLPDPPLYATWPELPLLVPDDKRAVNYVSDSRDECGVANLEGYVLHLIFKVAVDDHLPAPGVQGEQATTEIALVEIGGNVLGVRAALIHEPLAISQDGNLVVGSARQPDDHRAVPVGNIDQLRLGASASHGLSHSNAKGAVGELVYLQPGGHRSNYTQSKMNTQLLGTRFAWGSRGSKGQVKAFIRWRGRASDWRGVGVARPRGEQHRLGEAASLVSTAFSLQSLGGPFLASGQGTRRGNALKVPFLCELARSFGVSFTDSPCTRAKRKRS